jgi:hypothetical protein
MYRGFKRVWKTFDDEVLKTYFGGSTEVTSGHDIADQHRGNYELGSYSYETAGEANHHDFETDHEDDVIDNIETVKE